MEGRETFIRNAESVENVAVYVDQKAKMQQKNGNTNIEKIHLPNELFGLS